jgi:hypothetical protein
LFVEENLRFEELEHSFHGTEYAATMTQHVVMTSVRMGLHPDFASMFTQHLKDTNLVVYRERQQKFRQDRSLYVKRLKVDNGGKLLDVSDPEGGDAYEPTPFARVLMMSEEAIKRRKRLLYEVTGGMDVDNAQKTNTALAIDWLFYESCADAMGNAVHMRQYFTDYFHDFNGHSAATFNTEKTISANYLVSVGATQFNVADDADEFRRGFGLMMLHDALLAKSVVKSDRQAVWIINGLRDLPRFRDAHTPQEISERLKALVPRQDVERYIGEFVLAVCDPSLDEFYRDQIENEERES